ncbi:MAG: LPS export ABC transporter periplasmic protein LptC [Candidatus Gastranaerophilaceae bacterium]
MKRFLVYLRKLKNLNNKQKAYVILFFALGMTLLWAFLGAGFLTHGFSRSQVKNGEDRQKIDASSMILTETKEGTKFWEIYGETGTYNTDEKVALLTNVMGNFYKNNEVTMSFQSTQATYNEVKNQIILYNNTYIVIKDGTSLRADRLIWSGSDKDIQAQGNIIINKNGELFATGDKVIISPDYSHFKIVGKTVSKIFDKNGNKNAGKRDSKGILF